MGYDFAVVGGGAAGLAAAIVAAEQGVHTVVLEAQSRPGRKLLSTGNGRCNLTNLAAAPKYYHGGDADLAAQVLGQYPAGRVLDFFARLGLPCKELAEGRMYPRSLQAASVLDTLCMALRDREAEVRCDFPVTAIEKKKNGFRLMGPEGSAVEAKKVLLCCGGKSAPQLGGTDSGLVLAKSLGHTVTPLQPGLGGLTCSGQRAKPLKGARNPAKVTLLCKGKKIASSEGEVQFTDQGISGICVQELSRWVSGQPESYVLSLDLVPDWDEVELLRHLRLRAKSPSLSSGDLLCNCMNRLLAREIARRAVPGNGPASALRQGELEKLTRAAKGFEIPVTGLQGWSGAQVMAGGVPLKEVELSTMESRKCRGLYLAGEMLDLDGDCGGFNLHWAWATGLIAGKNAR